MSQPRRILIVRPSALGDVARTVPALVTLKRAFPDASIDWLVQDTYADIVRHHPALNSVVPFPRKRFSRMHRDPSALREFIRWSRSLRAARYDWVIDLQGLLRSGLFTWLTRAPHRVGPSDAREGAWLGYNKRIDPGTAPHTVDRMLAVLAGLGLPIVTDLSLYVGDNDRAWLDTFVQQNSLTLDRYAVVAPTAKWLCKCWPIENYTRLAARLLQSQRVGERIVVLAAPSEQSQIQPLLDALGNRAIVPSTTVGQMAAVLSRAALVVCNDSAPLHIAVGFNRPVVAMFGPTDPAKVGPYHRDDSVVLPSNGSMSSAGYRSSPDDQTLIASIEFDRVWEKVEQRLKLLS